MLVISREPGESIRIGSANDGYDVTLLDVLYVYSSARFLVRRVGAESRMRVDDPTFELMPGEFFQIEQSIRIGFIEFRGTKVRVGVVAPKEISVHRLEVWQAIANERGSTNPGDSCDEA